ncbi:beta strand repeat-containing protein, partial [Rhizobium halophytocola]|nr:Ca2+-binding RTX toxin-like protein [Rhizobium halophytocola]
MFDSLISARRSNNPEPTISEEPKGAVQVLQPVLLEPRVMLDANLEWDLGGGLHVSDALTSFADAFSHQVDDITDFLHAFLHDIETAAHTLDTMTGQSSPDSASDELTGVTDAVARILGAIEELRNGILSTVHDLGASGGDSTDTLSVLLTDVKLDGKTVISFQQDDDPSNNAVVDVSIALPDGSIDIDALLAKVMGDFSLSGDLSQTNNESVAITFSIGSSVDLKDGDVQSIGVSISDFDFPDLFHLGGDVSAPDGTNLSLGMLDLNVIQVNLAQLRIAVSAGDLDLGMTYDVTHHTQSSHFSDSDAIGVEAQIKQIGSTTYEAIQADKQYDLVSIVSTGSLNVSGTDYAYTSDLILSSALESHDASTPLDSFVDHASVDFDLQLADTTVEAGLAQTVETMVKAFSVMGVDEVLAFLADIGQSLNAILSDSAFDIDLPLTDLNLSDVIDQLTGILSNLPDEFRIDPASIGFGTDDAAINLFHQMTSQESGAISAAMLNTLSGYSSITLSIIDAAGVIHTVAVHLDAAVTNANASVEDRLAALAGLFSGALSSYGITAGVDGTALRFSSTKTTVSGKSGYATFALTSATTKNGTEDDDFGLANLGFGETSYISIDGVFDVDSWAQEQILRFGDASESAATGAIDFSNLEDVHMLRYTITIDGVQRYLDVTSEDGWSSSADLAADINSALQQLGVGVTASANGDSIAFALDTHENRFITIDVDVSQLLRASDIDSLMTWVSDTLGSVIDGVGLVLTTNGELVLDFSGLTASLVSDPDAPADFNASDIGLGMLGDLTLSAQLQTSMHAVLNGSGGLDLLGFVNDLTANGETVLSANTSLGGDLADLMEDNMYFQDVALAVDVLATASNITGSANVGMISVDIGSQNASENFLVLNAQLDVTLVGTDENGNFSDRLSFSNVLDAILTRVDQVGDEAVVTEALGVSSLIGSFNLRGGILANGDGHGIDANGNIIDATGKVVVVDADTYPGGDPLAELLVHLGDVTVTVSGLEGIGSDLIDGVDFTVADLLQLADTATVALTGSDAESLSSLGALTSLDDDDIFASLVAIANMLELVTDSLSEELPFLDQAIPLLNFSILDVISFSADFVDALNALRNNPQSGLDVVEGYLNSVFGEGSTEVTWDAATQTVLFDLSFDFLEDYATSSNFQLDIGALLGDALSSMLGDDLADIVSSLTAAGAGATLVFNPLLSFNFSFGIDLSNSGLNPTTVASRDTPLSELADASTVNLNPNEGAEIKITWENADSGESQTLKFDADGYDTVGELVDALNTAVKQSFGDSVSVTFDAETGQVMLVDSDASKVDNTGVLALFGTTDAGSTAINGVQTIALSSGFHGYDEATSFTVNIGGEDIAIDIPQADGRTAEGFAAAVNAALKELDVPRSALGGNSANSSTIAASQLLNVSVGANGQIVIQETNFAQAAGYDAFAFSVSGADASETVSFTVTNLGGSNIATILGLVTTGTVIGGSVVGEPLFTGHDAGAPRIFLDTEKTGLELSFTAGAEDLNLELALGPITIGVSDGVAIINAGDGSGDAAHISLTIADIDGDDHDGQFDLSALAKLGGTSGHSVSDLFIVDIQIGIEIDLPFSDNFGLFDPSENGLHWMTTLLGMVDGANFADFSLSNIRGTFEGALVDLFMDGKIDISGFEFSLPDLNEYFSNLNIFDLLNNPTLILEGLDTIFSQIQSLLDNYLGGIDLPLIGDAIGDGVTMFEQFRYYVIDAALEYAQTPLEDGSKPTTVDLLTHFVNDTLNSVFGTDDVTYMQAYLNTDGGTSDSYIYAVLNFSQVLFSEMIDIDFDLGIPGFNLEMEEGSQVLMQIAYTVNIGFGYDKNGFFLLNDTDAPELALEFLVDAGSFAGSMSILNILGLSAAAVTTDEDGNLIAGDGTAYVSASLEADLFGTQGLTIASPDAQVPGVETPGTAYRDFSGIVSLDAEGHELTFENMIYFSQLNFNNLAALSFHAEFDIQIAFEANIFDPNTAEPIKIGGVQIIPSLATEFLFHGSYNGGDAAVTIDKLEFSKVRVDASAIYDAFLAPILDPIMEFIEPLASAFDFLGDFPFDLLVDVLSKFCPILGIIDSVAQTLNDIADFITAIEKTGGWLEIGTYDFTHAAQDAQEEGSTKLDTHDVKFTATPGKTNALLTTGAGTAPGTTPVAKNPTGFFGDISKGFSVEINLITDPMNVLKMLLGDLSNVQIVTVNYTLFDMHMHFDLAETIIETLHMPGWAAKIINSAFKFTLDFDMEARFSVVYTLEGVVNFVETHDAERLLDGINIDTDLLYVNIHIAAGLNFTIAGLDVSGGVTIDLNFNDPNGNGLLSFPELLEIIGAVGDADNFWDALGYIFEGTFEVDFHLGIWVGIDLGFFSLKWHADIISFDLNYHFGGKDLPPHMSNDFGRGGTAILNVGANVAASFSKITEDGNDHIVVRQDGSKIAIDMSQGGAPVTGEINSNAGAIIIPAGEGNNVVDLSQMSGTTTITYTGSGKDQITLPDTGTHVVFAGGGDDTITAGENASGVYIIFGQGGSDTVNIPGGTVIYIGDDDYGMRDLFQTEFANGNVSVEAILQLVGLNADGTPNENAPANYAVGSGTYNLADLLTNYTAATQTLASGAADHVTLGAVEGAIVLTGAGNDVINIDLDATGDVQVFSGAGNDLIQTGGSNIYVEGGAGSDIIQVEGDKTEVWGWGAAAGESGLPADTSYLGALALSDGADILIGGSGEDVLHGQLGDDILAGGGGDDTLSGGTGNDIITGGTFQFTSPGGVIDVAHLDLSHPLSSPLSISVLDAADGDDTIYGGAGDDILVGGGGDDSMYGEGGADLLVGDFATIKTTSAMIVQSVISTFATSANAGTDKLDGGKGNDILMAGGAKAGETETLVDVDGDNVLIGDFAELRGTRLMDAVTYIASIASDNGGGDIITSGAGNDIIIGGEGADTISSGLGGDLILGDNGIIDIASSTLTGVATANDGDDVIVTGLGQSSGSGTTPFDLIDLVIGGTGNDTVSGQAGGMVFLGDTGTMKLSATALSALRSYTPPSADASDEKMAAGAKTLALIQTIVRTLESTAQTTDGNDHLSVAGGNVTAILGGGNDEADLGDGDAAILGDDGRITVDPDSTYEKSIITLDSAASLAATNADRITSGNGRVLAIGGADDDRIELGNGGNSVVGDNGKIVRSEDGGATVVSTLAKIGGNDTIITGAGDDIVIGGAGNDTIHAGDGNNTILGDSGSYGNGRLASDSLQNDGDDIVTSGSGNDVVILGGGADTADLGDGDNWVIGDSGEIVWTDATDVSLTTTSPEVGGEDAINTGTGDDIVIGGAGSDTLHAGDGDNIVLGDSGTYQAGSTNRLVSETHDSDGDDIVTSGSGSGNDIVILGGGKDAADLGNGDNWTIGDSGEIVWKDATDVSLTTTSPEVGGEDAINTGTGDDIVIGGAGSDTLHTGDGDNIVLGDSGSYQAGSTNRLASETHDSDGDDIVTSGSGNDIVILGGGKDAADLGNGDNWVIGDSGEIVWTDAADVSLTTTSPEVGGEDAINTGTGDEIVIGGAGNDTLHAGDGDNIILGDSGSYQAGSTKRLVSETHDSDGDDIVTSGSGNDIVILGGGADTADLGDGDNWVIGDSGEIVWTDASDVSLTTTSPEIGGNDTITTGTGDDIVIGGAGSDTLHTGDGDNIILGDSGSYQAGSTNRLASETHDSDGDDLVTSGSGNDIVILGGGADKADLGDGDNWVIGDSGEIVRTDAVDVSLTTTSPEIGGNDTINTGTGDDIVIGGAGSDTLHTGDGDNIILGDSGSYRAGSTNRLASETHDSDGDDIVTTGAGNDIVILGGGADTADMGDGDNWVVGDSGEIVWTDASDVSLTTTSPAIGGSDIITTGTGDDIVIGGAGSDTLHAGDGDNIILGDSGSYQAGSTNRLASETHDSDGDDIVTSGSGNDIVILGGGADTADLGDGDNWVVGDSGEIVWTDAADVSLTTTSPEIGGGDTITTGTGDDIVIGGAG